MTTPRIPKSPARKKARVWKAWVVTHPHAKHRHALMRVLSETISGADCIGPFKALAVYSSRRAAMRRRMGCLAVVRVEIREVLPAPVPPRLRKSKGGGK